MAIKFHPRRVCGTTEAAGLYGCTGSHIRGMAVRGEIWTKALGPRAWLYDADEIARLASEREKLRQAGKLRGRRPGHLRSA
jgi:hypothetical protein